MRYKNKKLKNSLVKEYVPQDGDICAIDIYDTEDSEIQNKTVIFCIRSIVETQEAPINYYFAINSNGEFKINHRFGYEYGDVIRLATREEAKYLYTALIKDILYKYPNYLK